MTLPGRGTASAALVLCAFWVPAESRGQSAPMLMELRGGVAAAVGSFASSGRTGEGAGAGPAAGVTLAFPGEGRRTFYVGFSQHRFGCGDAGCAPDASYVATGFDMGFRFNLRSSGTVLPWVRVGALTTRLETKTLPVPDRGVSRLGVGGEVGVGVYVGAMSPIAFNPGLRYTAVNTELPGGELLRMRYVVTDLALVVAF